MAISPASFCRTTTRLLAGASVSSAAPIAADGFYNAPPNLHAPSVRPPARRLRRVASPWAAADDNRLRRRRGAHSAGSDPILLLGAMQTACAAPARYEKPATHSNSGSHRLNVIDILAFTNANPTTRHRSCDSTADRYRLLAFNRGKRSRRRSSRDPQRPPSFPA